MVARERTSPGEVVPWVLGQPLAEEQPPDRGEHRTLRSPSTAMTMRRAPWLLVALATHVNAQFVETSEQYKEAMELSEATLQDEIRNTKDTQDHFYPARLFFDRDQYVFRPPHPQLYAIGMIVDPCGCMDAPDTCVPDCCVHRFGSAVYPWVKRELVDYYPRVPTSKFDHMLLAPPGEILANVNLVDVYGGEIEEGELRRADDEVFLDEGCDGIASEQGEYLYRLGEDGLLRPLSDKTHCQGMRLGNRPFPIKPNCSDNNATVDARQPCTDIETGITRPNCVQVGIAQTAVVINCGTSPNPDDPDFSEHQHCGKNDQCGDQHDASQAEHGAEQLLDAADQVGDGLADQHHQIHLFRKSLQQHNNADAARQQQQDHKQMSNHQPDGEPTSPPEDATLIALGGTSEFGHGTRLYPDPRIQRSNSIRTNSFGQSIKVRLPTVQSP